MGSKLAEACFTCMRIVLVLLNCLFMLIGLGLIAVTLFFRFSKPAAGIGTILQTYYALFYVLIGLGAFTLIVGFVGCLGACRKSSVCLGIYITILLIIFVAELIIGILGFIFKEKLSSAGNSTFDNMIKDYNERSTISPVMQLQGLLKCCGGNGPHEYLKDVPGSCCGRTDASTCARKKAYKVGCKRKFEEMFQGKGFQIALGVIIGIALIEFIGIVFAIAVCCQGRRDDNRYVSVVT